MLPFSNFLVETKRQCTSQNVRVPLLENYKIGKVLGEGSFAICYEVTLLNAVDECEEVYACRILKHSTGTSLQGFDIETVSAFLQESMLQNCINHKNVVRLFHWIDEPNILCQILDVCQLGSLELLLQQYHRFSEAEARFLLKQIIDGVHCLHVDHHILHRDLKPANILVTTGQIVKIGDFGTALAFVTETKLAVVEGTLNYMSPEVVKSYVMKNFHPYTFSPDIWSIGCMFYEFLVGLTPFHVDSSSPDSERFKRICSGIYDFPEKIEGKTLFIKPTTISFIRCLLTLHQEKRPRIDAIRQHPYITEASPQFLTSWIPHLKPTNVSCSIILDQTIKHVNILIIELEKTQKYFATKRNAQGTIIFVVSHQPEVAEFPDHVTWSMHYESDRIFNYRMTYGIRGVYFPDKTAFIYYPSKEVRILTNEEEFVCSSESIPEVLAGRVGVSEVEDMWLAESLNPKVVNVDGPYNYVLSWLPNLDASHRSYILNDGTFQISKPGTNPTMNVLFTPSRVYLPFWDKDENKYKAKICLLDKLKYYDLQIQEDVQRWIKKAIYILKVFRCPLEEVNMQKTVSEIVIPDD